MKSPRGSTSFLALFRNRNLALLLYAQIISQIGDVLFDLGVLWFTYQATASTLATGLVAAVYYLPALFASPIAGVVVDRYQPKIIMVMADLIRAALVAALALASSAGLPPTWLVVLVNFLLGIMMRFFLPAKYAWMPALMEPAELKTANAIVMLLFQLRLVMGGVAALFVLGWGPPRLVFLLDAVSFIVSALLTLRVAGAPVERSRRAVASLGREMAQLLRQAVLGSVRVLADRTCGPLVMLTSLDGLVLMGAWTIGAPLFASQWVDSGVGSATFSGLQIAFGIGAVAGSFVVGKWLNGHEHLHASLGVAYGLRAVAFLGLAAHPASASLAPFLFASLAGITVPVVTVTVRTLLQQWGARAELGRVFGTYEMVVSLTISFSNVIYGALGKLLDVGDLFRLGAGGALGFILISTALLRWARERGALTGSGP